MDISVIVPLFNEEESLPELFAWIKRVMEANHFSYEVIFVNDYRTPQSLGTDRMAAVAGALKMLPGENVLVIDVGSCVTYDVLTADGHYLGGNIAPGLLMRFCSMHEHTARLPLVSADGERLSLGRDTETALRAGALKGIEYEIEGYVKDLHNRFGQVKVVLTGGDSDHFKDVLAKVAVYDAHLVVHRRIAGIDGFAS